jgi:hypothetical protein
MLAVARCGIAELVEAQRLVLAQHEAQSKEFAAAIPLG